MSVENLANRLLRARGSLVAWSSWSPARAVDSRVINSNWREGNGLISSNWREGNRVNNWRDGNGLISSNWRERETG